MTGQGSPPSRQVATTPDQARQVWCHVCGAAPGDACVTNKTWPGRTKQFPHAARYAAFRTAQNAPTDGAS